MRRRKGGLTLEQALEERELYRQMYERANRKRRAAEERAEDATAKWIDQQKRYADLWALNSKRFSDLTRALRELARAVGDWGEDDGPKLDTVAMDLETLQAIEIFRREAQDRFCSDPGTRIGGVRLEALDQGVAIVVVRPGRPRPRDFPENP